MGAQQELHGAVGRFESYLKADPDNHLLWLELAELQHRLGQFDRAVDSFHKALALSPGLPAARSGIALVHISEHRFTDAQQQLQQLVDEGHQDPALQHNLGLALFYQDRWAQAQQHFEAAAAAGLAAPSNHAYLARCLHYAGRMDEAIGAARQWAGAAGDPAAIGYLALLEMDNGNRAGAAELAAQALAADTANTDAAIVAGTAAMEQQDAQAAGAHFNAVLEKDPQSGRGWLGLGLTHLYNQDPARGIDALKKAQQFMPGNSGTIVALGWAKLSQQDFAGAEQSFLEAVEADRGFAEAHGGLASSLVLQRRFDEARKAMQVADRLDRRNFGSVYARSIMLKLEGRSELATRLIAGALDRPLEESGKPLVEHIRIFAEQSGKTPRGNGK